jgi:hypothetical protein
MQSRNNADHAPLERPAGHRSHCARFHIDAGPPAITLTITMPYASVNINTASLLPQEAMPSVGQCDIQATVGAG